MSLKGIISISGMPGLYKVIAQSKSGFIVESLTDKKRLPVSATQRISMLDDISVFTTTDDIPLRTVLLTMKEHASNNTIADPKAEPGKLKDFFLKIVPEFDAERVYASDIKKMINWFHLVKDFVAIEDQVEEVVETTPVVAEEKAKEKEEKIVKKKRATSAEANSETEENKQAAPKAAKPRKKKETQ
ncbi:MAG: DUF5606 domain-containing protein [Bacteroidetes bacterium]|nr:DUF5606 domain-containing protein [Bacteroidota bacterium]